MPIRKNLLSIFILVSFCAGSSLVAERAFGTDYPNTTPQLHWHQAVYHYNNAVLNHQAAMAGYHFTQGQSHPIIEQHMTAAHQSYEAHMEHYKLYYLHAQQQAYPQPYYQGGGYGQAVQHPSYVLQQQQHQGGYGASGGGYTPQQYGGQPQAQQQGYAQPYGAQNTGYGGVYGGGGANFYGFQQNASH